MSKSGQEALTGGREVLPDIQEWSGDPPGCPRVVGRSTPDDHEWMGGPHGWSGVPPGYPGVVRRPHGCSRGPPRCPGVLGRPS